MDLMYAKNVLASLPLVYPIVPVLPAYLGSFAANL